MGQTWIMGQTWTMGNNLRTNKLVGEAMSDHMAPTKVNNNPQDPCMLYMVTFTINIPKILAYIPYMDPTGKSE